MRPPALALVTCLLAVAAASGGAASSAPLEVVAHVVDGDTIALAGGERVRLVQIDAPESGECYGRSSRAALVALLPRGARVGLIRDAALDDVDRFDRLLRYVWRGSLNVNVELVRRGTAAPYFYGGDRGRYAGRLLALARTARAARRGLWGACPGTRLDPTRTLDTSTSVPIAPVAGGGCDPNYAGACVPRYPPDLDCDELRARGLALPVRVVGDDLHRLDGDRDGYGCE